MCLSHLLAKRGKERDKASLMQRHIKHANPSFPFDLISGSSPLLFMFFPYLCDLGIRQEESSGLEAILSLVYGRSQLQGGH